MIYRLSLCIALITLLVIPVFATDQDKSTSTPNPGATSAAVPAAGEQIKWQVISGGGSRGTSASYIVSGTVGQTAVGLATSASYKINQGFWQDFGTGGCCTGTTGNVNMAGIVDLSDLSALVSYLTGGGYALPCVPEANINNAGIVDLSDLSALVSYLTGGGYVLPNCA
ncbi:hypothetical protein C3F09_11520 [candidate division GN15 bacterium]|uniref:Dockerin domain-containing protein n=1 Tax=candidate division GN15 bacterium TaxID=2072418 RepID=A0A855X0E3_9BACT|nr:MAG: hypothetical protein C3F09_11520 [candidate division GN15 bacterium]